MITITFSEPVRLQAGEIGGPAGTYFHWNNGAYVVVLRTSAIGGTRKYEPGSIETTPSAVSHENNCIHYYADGSVDKVLLDRVSVEVLGNNGSHALTVRVSTPSRIRTFYNVFAVCVDEEVVAHHDNTETIYLDSVNYPWYRYLDEKVHFKVDRIERNKLYCSFDVDQTVYELLYSDRSRRREVSEMGGISYPSYTDDKHWCNLSDFDVWQPRSTVSETYEMVRELLSVEYGGLQRLVARLDEVADELYDDGELSLEGAESVRTANINTVLYLKDFAEIGSLAKSLTEFASAELKVRPVLKAASAAYLALHYGVRLTRQDTDELAAGIDRIDFDHSYQTVGASHSEVVSLPGWPDIPVQVDYRLTARIRNWTDEQLFFLDKVKKLRRAMYELDVVPSIANIWDAIPFSFLVDWIVPIGDQAERLESSHYMQTLQLQKAFYSRRYTWSWDLSETSRNGNLYRGRVRYGYYRRRVATSFTEPLFRAERPQGSFTHAVEGSALFVQMFL